MPNLLKLTSVGHSLKSFIDFNYDPNDDDNLIYQILIYVSIFLAILVVFVVAYIVFYCLCGRREDFSDDDSGKKSRNKMLEFQNTAKFPEKSRSKTNQIHKIKKKENEIRAILQNR